MDALAEAMNWHRSLKYPLKIRCSAAKRRNWQFSLTMTKDFTVFSR
jgi:hypothetical protein